MVEPRVAARELLASGVFEEIVDGGADGEVIGGVEVSRDNRERVAAESGIEEPERLSLMAS